MTKDRGHAFAGVEKLLQETFLPRLFFVKSKSLPPIVVTLSIIPVNKYVLGLQEPVSSSNKKYLSLLCASSELIGAVTRASECSTSNHPLSLREERRDRKKIWDDFNNVKLKGLVQYLKAPDRHLILCSKKTVSWLTVRGTTVIDAALAATEFCDFLCAPYDVTPPNLQQKYNIFYNSFSVHHGLNCSRVGLIIARHNEVHDEILYLSRRALPYK